MTQAGYARHAGVNPKTITKWLKEGRISAMPDGRIDAVLADRQRLATESPLPRHQARKDQIDEAKAGAANYADWLQRHQARKAQADAAPAVVSGPDAPPPAIEPPADDPLITVGTNLKHETWRLQRAKADLAAMDVDTRAGLLAERAAVEFILRDLASEIRRHLEQMPAALAPVLVGYGGDLPAMLGELERWAGDTQHSLAAHFAAMSAKRLPPLAADEPAA
jgi:hypothetical protein